MPHWCCGCANSTRRRGALGDKRDRNRTAPAGRGAHWACARAELERLAMRTGALLTTTARAKEMFDSHPCNLGIFGSFSTSVAWRHIDEADCVIVFGASLNHYTSSFGTPIPEVPIIQVDVQRANTGRWLNDDVAIVGDARHVARQLLEAVSDRNDAAKSFHAPAVLANIGFRQDFEPANTARTVDPRSLGLARARPDHTTALTIGDGRFPRTRVMPRSTPTSPMRAYAHNSRLCPLQP